MAQTVITVADLANFKFADGESFEIAFETSGSDKDPKTGKVIKRNPIKLIGIVDVSGLTLDVLGWAGVKEAKTKEAGAISQNFDCEQIDLFKSDLKQVDDAYEHRFMFTQAGSIRPQETLTQVRDEMIARLEQRKGRKLKKSEIDAIDTILAS